MGTDDTVTVRVRDMDVLLTAARWDRLRAQAPVPAASDDMTDHALGELDAIADRARAMGDDELLDAYGRAEVDSVEAVVLDAEIERRGLDA